MESTLKYVKAKNWPVIFKIGAFKNHTKAFHL